MMKQYHKLSALLLSGLLLVGGSAVLTGCDDDDVDTNQYNRSGVNLVAFGPCPLTRLAEMRITGTQLDKVTKVLFPQGNSLVSPSTGYEEAPFKLVSSEEITVTVPDQTIPGKLRLVAGSDTIVSKTNITFEEEVTVSKVSPTQNLRAGDIVTISGEYVWNIASVTFTDHIVVEAENFLVNTRKEIKVAVPLEARAGEITFGMGEDTEETWKDPLEIRQAAVESLSNSTPEFGETLILRGTDLDLVTGISFPLVEGVPFTVNATGTELTTTVPTNTISGVISMSLYSGLTVESPEFAVPLATYAEGSIAPVEDLKAGDVVTLTGENLDRIVSLSLPGGITLNQGEFTQSATQIQFTVPEGMGDGAVTLVQHENYSVQTDKIAMHHEGAEIPIWQGSVTIGNWDGSMSDLSWGGYDWSTVQPGQILTAYLTMNAGADYAQVRFGNGSWAALPSSGGDINIASTDERISVTLTQADIDELVNNGGLVICGANFTITKVTLSVLETVVWSGTFDGSGWAGFEELSWGRYDNDFASFTLGQKFVVTFLSTTPDLGWGCITFKTAAAWENLPSGQIDFAGSPDEQTITFTPTADDIARIQTEHGLILQGDGYILKKIVIQ